MLAASDLFDMFTQSIKFLQMFENCDSSNRQQKWMVVPFSKFYGKFGFVFVLTLENAFS